MLVVVMHTVAYKQLKHSICGGAQHELGLSE
jgi:hypothetical protein